MSRITFVTKGASNVLSAKVKIYVQGAQTNLLIEIMHTKGSLSYPRNSWDFFFSIQCVSAITEEIHCRKQNIWSIFQNAASISIAQTVGDKVWNIYKWLFTGFQPCTYSQRYMYNTMWLTGARKQQMRSHSVLSDKRQSNILWSSTFTSSPVKVKVQGGWRWSRNLGCLSFNHTLYTFLRTKTLFFDLSFKNVSNVIFNYLNMRPKLEFMFVTLEPVMTLFFSFFFFF